MDATIVTALAGILGSICRASASVATSWVTHKGRTRGEVGRTEFNKRETLSGEFIIECSKQLMDAHDPNLDKPDRLMAIYA